MEKYYKILVDQINKELANVKSKVRFIKKRLDLRDRS